MDQNPSIESQLPLTEATFFILLSLAPGEMHGYAIMKDVRALSHDRVVLSTGTLYSALKRLLEQGWIQRSGEGVKHFNGRVRKAYHLTPVGQQILQAEIGRLEGLVSAAQKRPLEGLA